MSRTRPRDPGLLTNGDVNEQPFACCRNKELIFLRCPACAHIMVLCYECDTLYPSLSDLSRRENINLTHLDHRLPCPGCSAPLADFSFLSGQHVDAYLPTAQQVIDAGFGHLLSRK